MLSNCNETQGILHHLISGIVSLNKLSWYNLGIFIMDPYVVVRYLLEVLSRLANPRARFRH